MDIFIKTYGNTTLVVITIIMILLTMYNRIKYLCLKKAAEKVAEVEKITNLTGEEKFALVVIWIERDLPVIFKNALVRSLIKTIVQFAYDNCFNYATRYIKRKTGYNISELLENIQNTSHEDATNS